MGYIFKTPDYNGGFDFTSIENMHLIKRDNDGNLLSSTPLNLIRKGLRTEKGGVVSYNENTVFLSTGKTASRELFNAYLIKKAIENEDDGGFRKSLEVKKGLLNSLLGRTPKSPSDGVSFNQKGGERPNHKYIERKPDPKNPDKYIYLYELPSGKRQWQNESGEEQPENKEAVKPDYLSDLQSGDTIKYQGMNARIGDIADNLIGVQTEKGNMVINRTEHIQKLNEQANYQIGQNIKHKGKDVTIKQLGDKVALVEDQDGQKNFILLEKQIRKTTANK